MTLTQANWIQRNIGDTKVFQVTQKLVDENKLDLVPQAMFQSIMDEWMAKTLFTRDKIAEQIYNKLHGVWKNEMH